MSTGIPISGIISHKRHVQSLYKRALRQLDSWVTEKAEYRYEATIMRCRFDQGCTETDPKLARELVKDAEEQLFKFRHYIPKFFQNSPGGVAYQREVVPPDWLADYWHPLEKEQYPEYFAKREAAKLEYVKSWVAKYQEKPKKAAN